MCRKKLSAVFGSFLSPYEYDRYRQIFLREYPQFLGKTYRDILPRQNTDSKYRQRRLCSPDCMMSGSTPTKMEYYAEREIMDLQDQYQKIYRLTAEINTRLSEGNSYLQIKQLALFLAHSEDYQSLYQMENRLIKLQHFLTIWREEQEKIPGAAMSAAIFYGVNSLDELEHKYCRIEYYGLRIENDVPRQYCDQLLDWLLEHRISGIALGIIIRNRTEKGRDNLLRIVQELKQRMELPQAVLLLQYCREKYSDDDAFALEEADCWLQASQWQKALEILTEIREPTGEIQEIITELRQAVKDNG